MARRDVDKLDPLPDSKLQQIDKEYLERHKLDELFGTLMRKMILEMPMDPVQYVIDSIEYNASYAKQDPATGLPEHRKNKLMDVYRMMDPEGTGSVSFENLQNFAGKYGGLTLGEAELKSMFTDFNPGSDNMISEKEFLRFFAKVSRTISNQAFEQMVKDLMA